MNFLKKIKFHDFWSIKKSKDFSLNLSSLRTESIGIIQGKSTSEHLPQTHELLYGRDVGGGGG